ncbi:MAG: polyphosphate polymerase domain-containing protein [Chloroflexales bacterium]|nr:polyphosphate polymerase domain-containing protein [Chloroflexales bacterium]
MLPVRRPIAPPPAVLAGAATLPPATTDMQQLLARFAPISLSEMDAVALQNRTDTKYLLTITRLAQALRALVGQYRVLEVDGVRLNPYQTLYFDTPDFALYLQHHAGKSNRYKVRSRRYVVTDQSFLEVKCKTNKDRTVKRRVPTEELATSCTPEVAGFIATCAPGLAGALEPKLWNAFSRITLVSTTHAERLTIDLDLSFRGAGRRVGLPGIAVAEVKQDGVNRGSGFIQQMHAASLQPTSFSKYCIGVALLFPQVKHNNFKPKLRLLQQLMGGVGNGS